MKHLNGIFVGIHFGNYHGEGVRKFKVDICEENECYVLIDDSKTNIESLDNSAVKGILFGDYSWNVTIDIPKANDWNDILKLFKIND